MTQARNSTNGENLSALFSQCWTGSRCIDKSRTVSVDLFLQSQTVQHRCRQELSRAKSRCHSLRCRSTIHSASKRRSLWDQNLDRIFCAVAIGCDEPGTQNASAAVDTTKAMRQNVHAPELETYSFPSDQATFLQVLMLICPVAWPWCRPVDTEYEPHLDHGSTSASLMELPAHSFQSHTWKPPLSQRHQALLWWLPGGKQLAGCPAAKPLCPLACK